MIKATTTCQPSREGDFPDHKLEKIMIDDTRCYHLHEPISVSLISREIVNHVCRQHAKGERWRDNLEFFVKFEVPNILADQLSNISLKK